MKKKLAILLIAVLSVFTLAACSGGGKEAEAVNGVATGFLDAIQAGDFPAAAEFCTKEALDGADIEQLAHLDQVFYNELGMDKKDLNDDARKSLDDFINTILSSFVTSYEITDTKVDGDTATVTANIVYGFNPNAIENINLNEEMTTLSQAYLKKNQDDLVEIYLNEGESAMMVKIVNDIMPDILSAYTNAVMATGKVDDQLQMKLTHQEDDRWIISEALISKIDAK